MSVRRMMRLAVVGLWSVLAACSDAVVSPPPPPPPPPPAVLLKDIVIAHLPAPYYHFEYDSTGRIAFVSFASELTRYDVTYDSGRIAELQNNILVNHDRLLYVYDAGHVAVVREVDDTGATFMLVVLSYNGDRLIGLERDRRVAGGFIIDKTMSMTYDSTGNLQVLTEHRPAIAELGQDEATFVDRFEAYDSGINVDGFGLIHDDFFDHLVLLPQVQLQKGNPGRQTRSGDGLNFVVDYTYSYDAEHRPISKSGALTILNGPDTGKQIQTSSVFTYY